MAGLQIYLFGPPLFRLEGVEVQPTRKKVTAVLSYLAIAGGRHSRQSLTTLLYPEQPRDSAQADFRQILYELRKLIGTDWVEADRSTVSIPARDDLWIDVNEFRRCVDLSKVSSAIEEEIEMLAHSAELYRNDLLAGFSLPDSIEFDDWQLLERAGLRSELGAVLARLSEIHGALGEFDAAISYGRRLLALDSMNEDVHRRLMWLFAYSGNRAAAVQQYEQCRSVLACELDQTPDDETERLLEEIEANRVVSATKEPQRILRHPSRAQPPSKGGSASNLPVQSTCFVGREEEIIEIRKLLSRDDVRALTLIGAGGSGKTRLALEAAGGMLDRYVHGVCFVDLAWLQDHSQVLAVIADTLDLGRSVGQRRSIKRVLHEYLRDKDVLILLDNFEHVLSAAPEIADLLAKTPGTRILATSREPLRIRAERQFFVQPLQVPSSSDEDLESLVAISSVRLFADRASRIDSDFSLDAANAKLVAQICRRLDGLPLAIELAVPSLLSLSLRELNDHLDDHLLLPQQGYVDLPERQKTLRSAIDWSYDLLIESERDIFARLGVFAGGFTSEAAHFMCVDGDPDSVRVLLASLLSKCLLRRDAGSGDVRYSMLETILQYARSRLSERPDAEAIRNAHAEYYLELAEATQPELYGPDQIERYLLLARESGNLLSALTRYASRQDAVGVLRMCNALGYYWARQGHFRMGQQWLERGLEMASERSTADFAPQALKAQATFHLGSLVHQQGDWARAHALYEESRAMFRSAGDRAGEVEPLCGLGIVTRWLGDVEQGRALNAEAIRIARETGSTHLIAYSLLAAYSTTGGKFAGKAPVEELQESLTLYQQDGDLFGVAHCHNGLGDLHAELGMHEAALEQYTDSLKLFRQVKDKWMIAWNLVGLGDVCASLLDEPSAESYYGGALELFDMLGDKVNSLMVISRIGTMRFSQGLAPLAARLLGAYKHLRDTIGPRMLSGSGDNAPELSAAIAACDADHTAEWTTGSSMTYRQVIELALAPTR